MFAKANALSSSSSKYLNIQPLNTRIRRNYEENQVQRMLDKKTRLGEVSEERSVIPAMGLKKPQFLAHFVIPAINGLIKHYKTGVF
jgi:hypothetical protein